MSVGTVLVIAWVLLKPFYKEWAKKNEPHVSQFCNSVWRLVKSYAVAQASPPAETIEIKIPLSPQSNASLVEWDKTIKNWERAIANETSVVKKSQLLRKCVTSLYQYLRPQERVRVLPTVEGMNSLLVKTEGDVLNSPLIKTEWDVLNFLLIKTEWDVLGDEAQIHMEETLTEWEFEDGLEEFEGEWKPVESDIESWERS